MDNIINKIEIIETPPLEVPPKKLTIRQPNVILSLPVDPTELIWGDYLLAKGQPTTILGPSGSGKSRLLLQLAASSIVGRDCVGVKMHREGLRWLILQTENGISRLKKDMSALKKWLSESEWEKVNNNLFIHTLETDIDGNLSLDNADSRSRIAEAIASFKPHIVSWDPLNRFCIGDPNSDRDMAATTEMITQLSKKGNPRRAIIVLHHTLTGKAGALKAVGFDRGSYARNSKVLLAWTRAQINLAPMDENNNDLLLFSCGKCSNGREFAPYCIRLNDSMIYDVANDVSIEKWQADLAGKKQPLCKPEDLPKMCKYDGIAKKALIESIRDKCGCSLAQAYRYINEAVAAKTIHQKEEEGSFYPGA